LNLARIFLLTLKAYLPFSALLLALFFWKSE